MQAKIIDGVKLSKHIMQVISEEICKLKMQTIIPGLAVIIVGDDKASKIYVRNKEMACKEVGIYSEKFELDYDTQESKLLNLINDLNNRSDIHGILVQLPLPKHINVNEVIKKISPYKDVDAFHPYNMGNTIIGQKGLSPCTPQGILDLIDSINVDVKGRNCVIVGSSNIVGKPMAMLMVNKGATVTICNIFTQDLKFHCRNADILIVAVGKENLITADMVKPGAVVIDVGLNRSEEGKIFGDVDFKEVSKIAGYITPVPGGVGPMTVAMLLKNTVMVAKLLRI